MCSNSYLLHLLKKGNRELYCSLAARYCTSPWVICRLIHGRSIRSEKELYIYWELVEGRFIGKEQVTK